MPNLQRGYTKEELSNMGVAKELLTNRYLLSTILSNLYRMNRGMELNFENIYDILQKNPAVIEPINKEEQIQVRKKARKHKKSVSVVEYVQFEKFSITSEQYETLVKEYGVDVVTEACIMLDGFFKDTNRDVKDSFIKLKQWAIHLVMKRRLANIRKDIVKITNAIEYDDIQDEATARKYIASVPDHMRNIDFGVKYLVEKFNIKE